MGAALPDGPRIHNPRHSFASTLAHAGTPLYEIGVVLGYSQLSSTTRYATTGPSAFRTAATASRGVEASARTRRRHRGAAERLRMLETRPPRPPAGWCRWAARGAFDRCADAGHHPIRGARPSQRERSRLECRNDRRDANC